VELGHGAPTINAIFSPTATNDGYWSSSREGFMSAWQVNFVSVSVGSIFSPVSSARCGRSVIDHLTL
jgi:hypothetical protein